MSIFYTAALDFKLKILTEKDKNVDFTHTHFSTKEQKENCPQKEPQIAVPEPDWNLLDFPLQTFLTLVSLFFFPNSTSCFFLLTVK